MLRELVEKSLILVLLCILVQLFAVDAKNEAEQQAMSHH